LLLAVICVLAEEKYTTKYDNIDLDSILMSDRLLKNYVNCLLDKGNCTPDAKELKGQLSSRLNYHLPLRSSRAETPLETCRAIGTLIFLFVCSSIADWNATPQSQCIR